MNALIEFTDIANIHKKFLRSNNSEQQGCPLMKDV